ncbi:MULTISPECIES: hypothetical protein [Bradyrhizobium]|uniref:hypothetical protein n=1 Tax=Bradyrhizobium TaxID=374 RepID=UPI001EDC7733|nr:hypothetical protein [Bradyrhizobium zhengyangense]MCG2645583.1 hypothetical protein [Bradyrhizobium zhengyangense]
MKLERNQIIVLHLINSQPLERCARDGWRFGTKQISDALVDRLIASEGAENRGEQPQLMASDNPRSGRNQAASRARAARPAPRPVAVGPRPPQELRSNHP